MKIPFLAALILLLLPGCLDGTLSEVQYWELQSTVIIEAPEDAPFGINQGPHCAWMRFQDGTLHHERSHGDPAPQRVLGHTWGNVTPDYGTMGSGYEWWSGDAEILATFGDSTIATFTWQEDSLFVNGAVAEDGMEWVVQYEAQVSDGSYPVTETLRLVDHGVVPLRITSYDGLLCE